MFLRPLCGRWQSTWRDKAGTGRWSEASQFRHGSSLGSPEISTWPSPSVMTPTARPWWRSLLSERYRPLASVEQEESGRPATMRLACPLGGGGDVGLGPLFASAAISTQLAPAPETIEMVAR